MIIDCHGHFTTAPVASTTGVPNSSSLPTTLSVSRSDQIW